MKKARRIDGQYKPVSDLCPVDNLPLYSHPRCARCGILVSEGHLEVKLYGKVCSVCTWGSREKAEAALGATP